MSLFTILSSARNSLAAQQAVTATASNNINNSNTDGYARQTAEVADAPPLDLAGGVFIGGGATLVGVHQSRDRFIEAQLPRVLGQAAHSSTEAQALQSLHALDASSSEGLGAALAGFYSSLRTLAQNPSDSGSRSAFLGAAQRLAQAFNVAKGAVEDTRTGLDAKLDGLAHEINSEARSIAELNFQIRQASATGGAPNALLDQRRLHLDKLAEYTGASQVMTSEGYVNVMLPGGVALVAGTKAAQLETTPEPSNDGHLALVLDQADGTGPVELGEGSFSGTVGGLLGARDGAIATAGERIDQLALDLSGKINEVHEAGFGLDGSTGLALFEVGEDTAATMKVAISDPDQLAMASTASASGDPRNAQALIATETAILSDGKDLQATLSDITSEFGAATETAKAFEGQDAAVKDELIKMRASFSGVSTDDELITLQNAQRSYEAISKVIQTTNDMLRTLMTISTT